MGDIARPRPYQKSPGTVSGLPGERKVTSKRARIARQKARAEKLNKSPEWFGVPRNSSPKRDEDRYESVTSLVDSKSVEKSTFTGIRELPVKNMLVILGLWFIRLFIPWVEAWHEFNLHLLVEPFHWAQREKYFTTHNIIVFIVKSLLCHAVSLTADFINFKYPTYFIILLLYMFAPIAGVAVIVAIGARAYDKAFYFDWWHKTVVMMMWASSVPFVTFPLQFSSIFNQEKGMSRLAHYNWTAIFVLIETLSACAAYWVIPPNCPTSYFTLIAVWCAIGVLILVLIIEVLSLMRCANSRNMSLNASKCKKNTSESINTEAEIGKSVPNPKTDLVTKVPTKPSKIIETSLGKSPPKDLKIKKLLWFTLILVPVIFTSVTFGIMKRTRPEEDWDKHDVITGTSMLITGQSIGVVVVVGVLFVVRKWLTKLHRIPMFNPDVLALGLPHLINTIALTVILARFFVLSGLSEGDVILGPIPTKDITVIEFYNAEFRNRSVCIHSEYFGPLKVPPRQRATGVIKDPGDATITFNVSLDPNTIPLVQTMGSFKYKKGVWITYVVTLPETELGSTDIEAFYSALVLIRINGTDDVRPKKEPQIVFINTYVVFTDGWYYNISGPRMETINQTFKGIAMTKNYPPGTLKITYWTEWKKLVERGSHPPVSVQLQVENYCVYTVLLCLSSPMKDPSNYSELVPRMLQTHKTMEVAGPNSKRLPAKEELERDWAIILGMTLAGMAKGGVYVGYIYLFWLDYPLNSFGTTFLASFWLLMAIPEELASIKVIDIGVTELILLLILQILFTNLHFASAIFLYTPKFNFRTRPD